MIRPARPLRARLPHRRIAGVAALIALVALVLPGSLPAAVADPTTAGGGLVVLPEGGVSPTGGRRAPAERWAWPVAPPHHVAAPFVAPAHAYGPGHRGLDIAPGASDEVRAPADGVVAFVGVVVDRGVVTIAHDGGLVSTLEPVSPAVVAGYAVRRGEIVGVLAHGGHAPSGALHLGARLEGAYIDPLMLLEAPPRAVLLPCC